MTATMEAQLADIGVWIRSNGLEIVLLILGAMLLARFITWSGDGITDRIDAVSPDADDLVRSEVSKYRHSIAQILVWLSIALVWFITGLLVLARFGIPIGSLAAPTALIAAAIGFGAQQVVRDYLAGFFIIAERQYGFGDLVRISAAGFAEGATGTIEDVSLRVTRLRTVNGEVVVVPNGQLAQVTNLSRGWARAVVDFPLPAGVDVLHANDVLRRVGSAAFADEQLRPLLLDEPTVMGVESIEIDRVTVRMVARTLPGKQFQVGRELRARVVMAFNREGLGAAAVLAAAIPATAAPGEGPPAGAAGAVTETGDGTSAAGTSGGPGRGR
ncbi:mechanosensitive ion channel family protein [Paenarthrobacter sp. PH39-S1]|uniref:mechanosensitive ion channel family protein n=1 Tax=Paenarthrobacter sp. PH39-S1 TaxID=3046204 RepID=UPI0024BA2F80|nr:mechanosensitive ion channel family protein [Paenarthrobacter sp. PH39-S1]MDJ0356478.1 mechanosensitive ion channel family protein [Paenarthrobacter sp. PH39-S1]